MQPPLAAATLAAQGQGRWLDMMVVDQPQEPPPSTKLARAALIAAFLGWLTFPIGLLAVAWALFVAIVSASPTAATVGRSREPRMPRSF